MVVGQLLITPTVEICIQQLGRLEEMGLITIRCDTEYLAWAASRGSVSGSGTIRKINVRSKADEMVSLI